MTSVPGRRRGGGVRLSALALPLSCILVLSGCAVLPGAVSTQRIPDDTPAVNLDQVPFYPQTAYDCGPAALAEILTYAGAPARPKELEPRTYVPDRQGTLQTELLSQARVAGRLAYRVPGSLDALTQELQAGNPVLILQNLGLSWAPRWHYAVVVAVEPESDTLVLRSGTRREHRIAADVFDRTWARGGRWAMVATPPGRLPATAQPLTTFRAMADLEGTSGVKRALPYWRAARQRWPRQGRMALGLANAEYNTGDVEAAAAVLRDASTRSGDHKGEILNNLAVIEAELGHRKAAIAAAESAVAQGGDNVERFRETLTEVRCGESGTTGCGPAETKQAAGTH